MSLPPGRPKEGSLPPGGKARSAKGAPVSPPGRPKGEYRSAQHEGSPVSAPGRPKRESLPLGGTARSAKGAPMTFWGAGSVTKALGRSLLVGLTLLWLTGVVGSGVVLKRLIDERSDHELHESAAMLMSLIAYTDDILMTAAMLGETRPHATAGNVAAHFTYLIRDASGRVLLQSPDASPDLHAVPPVPGQGSR